MTLGERSKLESRLPAGFCGRRNGIRAYASCVLVAALLASAGCATAPRRPTSVYVVKPGDTVSDLAVRFDTTVRQIARANRLRDPSRIRAGQRLVVPVAGVSRASPEPRGVASPARERRLLVSRRGMIWPVDGTISSRFGRRWGGEHEGIDIAAARGEPIRAAAAGRVVHAETPLRGYGRVVIVEHPGDRYTVYAHTDRNLVSTGDRVRRGQVIARVGASGNARKPHLHFEVRQGDRPVDPLKWLP